MSDDRRERLARVALGALREPAEPQISGLVARMGAVDVFERLLRDPHLKGVRSESSERLTVLDPAATLHRAERLGIRFVVPGDDEWPPGLADLDLCEPLSGMGGAPLGLWVRGAGHLGRLTERSVAVVGSRSSTDYGERVAGDLSAHLTLAGRVVVSGAAFGIDAAAHRAALGSRGPTVAVLARGVDRPYPVAHRELLDEIRKDGVVVSELAPGGAPMKARFLARNRLIAAMTQGTVIVEAAIRSGALNTASWAGLLHRVLMGVPGPVSSASSEGVHELLHGGTAALVSRGEHVMDLVGAVGEATWVPPRAPETLFDLLREGDRRVLEAVPLVNGVGPTSIARTAGVSVASAREALIRLEAEGWVEGGPGQWRHARRPPTLRRPQVVRSTGS